MGLEGDILKSLRIPLAVIDRDFHFLWLNQEMAQIYQTQPDRATGKICYQIINAENGPCHDCPVVAAQKSGRREMSQKYKDFPNGVRKFGDVSAFPIYDPKKNMVATLVMIIDVTHKIVVDMDPTYQMLTRLMSGVLGWMPWSLDSTGRKRKNHAHRPTQTVSSRLTRRETQVLHQLVKGCSNTQIGERLGISPHTVKSHVVSIFNKLGVNDRIQAAVVATKQGIVE